jgi:amidase
MASDEFAFVSATELASRIRKREVSPVEVMDATIARIETRNPSLNALVFTDFDGARKAAVKAENLLMSGIEVGPLHGVPSVLKDLFDFKPGWPSTYGGIRALKDNIAEWYCPFAERIEKAGAILVGKTNSPVMGFRGTCDNYFFGPTRNPFDGARNSGGSSGGSAAAVADGLLPLAEGTERAVRSASPPPGAMSMATRPRMAASRWSSARTRLPATCPSSSRARSRALWKTPRWR